MDTVKKKEIVKMGFCKVFFDMYNIDFSGKLVIGKFSRKNIVLRCK